LRVPLIVNRKALEPRLGGVADSLRRTLETGGNLAALEGELSFFTGEKSVDEFADIFGKTVPADVDGSRKIRVVDEARALGLGEVADLIESISILVHGAAFAIHQGMYSLGESLVWKSQRLSQLCERFRRA
jgi:hypothetical protein